MFPLANLDEHAHRECERFTERFVFSVVVDLVVASFFQSFLRLFLQHPVSTHKSMYPRSPIFSGPVRPPFARCISIRLLFLPFAIRGRAAPRAKSIYIKSIRRTSGREGGEALGDFLRKEV